MFCSEFDGRGWDDKIGERRVGEGIVDRIVDDW